jgi:outer membrane lipoprotein carrier protein
MRIIKLFIFFISALAFSQQAPAPLSDSETIQFKENVAKRSDGLKSLSSDFIQSKYIQLMQGVAVSNGRLFYKAPNILKWEYSTPYNYHILFKENQLFINDDGDKSVSNLKSNKLFEKLVNLISGSINGGLLADSQNYNVAYFKTGNYVTALIVPKDPAIRQMFREIILVFNKDYLVNSVKLMEDSGDFTEIFFKNIRINQNLEDSIFEN